MTREELNEIIERYAAGMTSEEEDAFLDNLYLQYYDDQPMDVSYSDRSDDLNRVKASLDEQYKEYKKSKVKLWPSIAIAATALCIISISLYCYNKQIERQRYNDFTILNDIAPGSGKAVLTLSNGKKIGLSAIQKSKVVKQAGIEIARTAADELIYTTASIIPHSEITYNKIEIPKGGKYQLRLPDGTRVWLNAASSLKYPTSFLSLKERKVKLSGEAYFEVTHQSGVPFVVETDNQRVEVFGTHFNINAYPDEQLIKTTLLEGSVGINKKVMLKPGQQALNSGSVISVKNVDTATEVDWKNGDFSFNKGDDFKSDMREIGRWYNVEFVYSSSASPKMELGGWVARKNKLSTVLNRIESTGKVHFKIDGRRIMVIN
ncbi:FecR family protein [Pedobacter sp. L105]|uniref:FecR family protein n=1 Tax=Pedobacter sp. L105 TaxID=1641871 RepID=UPI00131AFDD4|nr:FecR family protein [Pedobacter sp. L105]